MCVCVCVDIYIAVRILRMMEVFQELLLHNIPVPIKHYHALLLRLMRSPTSSQKIEFIIKDIYSSQQRACCTIYFSIFLTGYWIFLEQICVCVYIYKKTIIYIFIACVCEYIIYVGTEPKCDKKD